MVDRSRRVVFVNRACEELTGWSSNELTGELCEFVSHVEPTDIRCVTGMLCPPPSVFDDQSQVVAKQFVHRETGQSVTLPIQFMPLQDGTETVFVLGVAVDIQSVAQPMDRSLVAEIHAELAALRQSVRERFGLRTIVGKSFVMQRVLRQIRSTAQTRTNVFIHGGPGSGKEHAARAIHYAGANKAKAFVPIECHRVSADQLSETLLRLIQTDWSEIAPIAALQAGCIYLESIESMPRDLQQRIGDFLSSPNGSAFLSNVSLIAASTVPSVELFEQSRLIHELYYRLTSLELTVPSLVERLEDLPLLAQHFLEQCNVGQAQQVAGFAADVMQLFHEYNWPGNLDELRQVVQEAHQQCKENTIRSGHLPFRFRTGLDAQSIGPAPLFEPLEKTLARVEREQIEAALQSSGDNKAKAAVLLGITRASLYRKLENLDID